MGREPFPWFSFKSKAQREKEQQRYGAWAFPYGAAQQERIRALLGELFPREEPSLAMVRYLNGRATGTTMARATRGATPWRTPWPPWSGGATAGPRRNCSSTPR